MTTVPASSAGAEPPANEAGSPEDPHPRRSDAVPRPSRPDPQTLREEYISARKLRDAGWLTFGLGLGGGMTMFTVGAVVAMDGFCIMSCSEEQKKTQRRGAIVIVTGLSVAAVGLVTGLGLVIAGTVKLKDVEKRRRSMPAVNVALDPGRSGMVTATWRF